MKDAKSVHIEIIEREQDDWRYGWEPVWPRVLACVVLVLAILIGGAI